MFNNIFTKFNYTCIFRQNALHLTHTDNAVTVWIRVYGTTLFNSIRIHLRPIHITYICSYVFTSTFKQIYLQMSMFLFQSALRPHHSITSLIPVVAFVPVAAFATNIKFLRYSLLWIFLFVLYNLTANHIRHPHLSLHAGLNSIFRNLIATAKFIQNTHTAFYAYWQCSDTHMYTYT